VHGLIAQSPSGAWSAGGAILTFVIPMVLFIIVAIGLYILYTKPSIVPGRRRPGDDHPVSYTSIPGRPLATQISGNPATAADNPGTGPGNQATASGYQSTVPGNQATGSSRAADVQTKAGEGEKAETEDGE
jgi:hypothetical protein